LIDTSDFRNGMSIELDGDIFTIVEFQHVKPGKGGAFVRTKLKNIKTSATLDKTFRPGEKIEQAFLERKPMSYPNSADGNHFSMDMESFEQIGLPAAVLGDSAKYLKENTEVQMLMHGEKIIGADVPFFMELEVTETDPAIRGDTASGGSKSATLETGAVVSVPLFINVGDRVKVDTRTNQYLERAK